MQRPVTLLTLLLATALLTFSGCGGDDGGDPNAPDPKDDPTDAAAKPPAGYKTVENKVAGFTASVPDDWTDASKNAGTRINSGDKVVSVQIAADRSEKGRTLAATKYAAEAAKVFRGFKVVEPVTKIKRSPYDSAQTDVVGKAAGQTAEQRVTIAVYHRPGRVTYGVLIFRNAERPNAEAKAIAVLKPSLRGQAPSASS